MAQVYLLWSAEACLALKARKLAALPCTCYALTLLLRFLLAGGWLTSLSCHPWHPFLICKQGVELKPWGYSGISSKTRPLIFSSRLIILRLFFKCVVRRPGVLSCWQSCFTGYRAWFPDYFLPFSGWFILTKWVSCNITGGCCVLI